MKVNFENLYNFFQSNSSSFNIILGIPFLIGYFLPQFKHSSKPSKMWVYNNILCSDKRKLSSSI